MKSSRLGGAWRLLLVAGVLSAWGIWVFAGKVRMSTAATESAMSLRTLEGELADAREETARRENLLRSLQAEDAMRNAAMTMEERRVRDLIALIDGGTGRVLTAESATSRRPQPPAGKMGSVCFPELMADPEYARLSAIYFRYEMETRYAPLFAGLMLAGQEHEKFVGLLVEKKLVEFDSEGALRQRLKTAAEGEALDKKNLDALMKTEIDGEIRAQLGEAVFDAYAEFERTWWTRLPVDAFTNRLEKRGEGISPEAVEKLRALLLTRGKSDDLRTRGSKRVEFTAEALSQAREFLSAEQWTVLNQVEAEKKAQTEFLTRTARAFLKKGGDVQSLKRLDEAAAKAKAADSTNGEISAPK